MHQSRLGVVVALMVSFFSTTTWARTTGPCESFFRLHLDSDWTYESFDRDAARSAVFETCNEQIGILFDAFGEGKIIEALGQLVSGNTIVDDHIPILFSGRPEHPHVINPGNPRSGIFMSAIRLPGFASLEESVREVFRHELSHVVLGKFNDGLTEVIANLFKGRSHFGAERRLNPSLLRAGIVEAAIENGQRLAGLESLSGIFGHRPAGRNGLCTFFDMTRDEALTRDLATVLVRRSYAGDLTRFPISLRQAEVEEELLMAWEERYSAELDDHHRRNPNETPGYARDYFADYGTQFVVFLVTHPNHGATERERTAKLFELYWGNGRGMAEIYRQDWRTMQRRFHDWIEGRLAEALPTIPDASRRYGELQASLRQDICLLDWASHSQCARATDPLVDFMWQIGVMGEAASKPPQAFEAANLSYPFEFARMVSSFRDYCSVSN